MKKKIAYFLKYLSIRFSIYSDIFFSVTIAISFITGLIFIFTGYTISAVTMFIGVILEAAMFYYYRVIARKVYIVYGINELDGHTGEIHTRYVNLANRDTDSILLDYRTSYHDIINIVQNSRGKTVHLITHKSLMRQMFTVLRIESISEFSENALNFLLNNMIKYKDFNSIELGTDERYTISLSYAGYKQNRAYALKWRWPTKKAMEKFTTPIPYFDVVISKNV